LKPLVDAGIGNLVVANRTLARADALARDMQSHNIALETQTLNAITGSYGLVINAISAGLDGDMPPLPPHLLADDACCYDLIYGGAGHLQTPFIRWAEAQGCQHAANGLGMLVEQAAASFYRWLGKQPKTQEVIALLRHDQKSECS
jgi:shikimate dehydrogenase